MTPLSLATLDTAAELTALEAEWRALEARCQVGLPFQTWAWNDAWWRHFAEGRLAVRDSLRLFTLRSAEGVLVGVAPMMLSRRPGVGPLCVRVIGPLGADPNVTELRVPLCDPAHEDQIYATLIDHLRGRAHEWDWVLWSGLRAGGEPEQRLTAAPGVTFVHDIPNYLLALPATWEALKSSRSRNVKESLRKCYNSLKRDNHAFALEVAITPTEVRAAVERFLELHATRSRLKETVRHPNVFASPNARAFLLQVCERFAAAGQVRVFQLRIAGTIVASRIAFALGDTLYLYYSGYDPEWGKYSVMTTTVAEALKFAIEHGFRWVNLSTGFDVSKTRWDPKEVVYRDVLQLSPTWRGRLSGALYHRLTSSRIRPAIRALMGRKARIS